MKKYIFIVITIFLSILSFDSFAGECVLPDGEIVSNCQIVDDNANVLVRWVHAEEREDNSKLNIDEIEGVKVYFNRLSDNWWPKANTYITSITAAYLYLPPGEYSGFATTIDTQGQESKPSMKITRMVEDQPELKPFPKAPGFSVTTTSITRITIQ